MPARPGFWLVVLGVGAVAIFTLLPMSAEDPVGRGSPAPGFELDRSGDGAPISLADLRGRVVLINFWATWCKPCEDEIPAMERLYRQLQPKGFVI